MCAPVAFPAYLKFPQWKSDVLCFEVATLIQRQENDQILLSCLGALLSPLGKRVLQQEKCKLKRFLTHATKDFVIDGSAGVEAVTFIGSPARLQPPSNLPEEESAAKAFIAHMATFESDVEMSADAMHAEIAAILSQRTDNTLLISQIGARLRPEARQWLRDQDVKLAQFLDQDARYVLDTTIGSETVTLVEAKAVDSDASTACGSSTTSEPVDLTAVMSRDSRPSVDCAAMVRSLLSSQSDLLALLSAAAPQCYED